MNEKWKKYLKRFFVIGAGVFSLFTGGYILLDLYVWKLGNVRSFTMTFLAIALFFTWITMTILACDLYSIKKEKQLQK